MSTEFKWFRDINTGKSAKYPASFGERFATLEEIDSGEAGCLDCLVVSEPDTDVYPEDLVFDDETEDDD